MKIRQYLEESAAQGGAQKYFNKLINMSPGKAEKVMKNSWDQFSNLLKAKVLEDDAIVIINKHFSTNYTSLGQIDKKKISSLPSIKIIDEDLKNYWKYIKSEAFPALAFYPVLNVFMELDKLVKGSDANIKIMIFYSAMWIMLSSGKFITLWKKWKNDNPKQFKKEGSKKNPFSLKKSKNVEDFTFEGK